jgi:hypothetical protein
MRNIHFERLVARVFQNRLLLLGILFVIQLQFFTINLLNAHLRAPDAGWELKIGVIDNNLTPDGLWLIPYVIGFFFAILVPLWAVFVMPTPLFRQFALAMMLAALFSYAVYILLPTYVVKPGPERVPGDHTLAEMLRRSYQADAAASTHNAAPSQHVFYAIINMCFVIRFRPKRGVFVAWVTLAALISASALLTMRHNSPDLIAGYGVAVGAYYGGLALGARVTACLDDAGAPPLTLPLPQRARRRLVDYRRRRQGIGATH